MTRHNEMITAEEAVAIVERQPRIKKGHEPCSEHVREAIIDSAPFVLRQVNIEMIRDPIRHDHFKGVELGDCDPPIVDRNMIVVDGFHRLSIMKTNDIKTATVYISKRCDNARLCNSRPKTWS